ncbi:Hsp70 family protein [Aliiroseovarius sp. 2305UL8-7]|uniref:Hsp70 family protein n=1 Tax=Aliiroseovarius conchicola TaxID=3121637 RepID=UPI003527E40D
MTSPILAVDFGTSNSAAAILDGNVVHRIAIEAEADTLPTAVFFPTEGGMRIGRAASDALIDGDDGRYMRALKSILGHDLLHESRLVGGKRQTLADVITSFLSAVKSRTETATGHTFQRVLSGRPVQFHSDNPTRDQQAEADLRACYHAAGFEQVDFLYEPEAAAHACHGMGGAGQTGLIVDIGGGTSDFSIYRSDGDTVTILASHGIRLGGTDFDQKISMSHVMALLGHGGQLRRTFGAGLQPMPNAIFQDLATWAKIPFLYSRETERKVDDLLQHAVEPAKLTRLRDVIEDRLGHELAFAVEAGKIAANARVGNARIDMEFVERGLEKPITPGTMNAALLGFRDDLKAAIHETLLRAQIAPVGIDAAVLVGGSSLMQLVSDEVLAVCPNVTLHQSEAFTAVVDGLALATKSQV